MQEAEQCSAECGAGGFGNLLGVAVRINELAAEGWRNLEPLRLVPGERLSVLYGDNGQGKTNILEAAFYLAALRSFRTSHNEDLIRRGDPAGRARLRADVTHRGLERRFEIELRPTGRCEAQPERLPPCASADVGVAARQG